MPVNSVVAIEPDQRREQREARARLQRARAERIPVNTNTTAAAGISTGAWST